MYFNYLYFNYFTTLLSDKWCWRRQKKRLLFDAFAVFHV